MQGIKKSDQGWLSWLFGGLASLLPSSSHNASSGVLVPAGSNSTGVKLADNIEGPGWGDQTVKGIELSGTTVAVTLILSATSLIALYMVKYSSVKKRKNVQWHFPGLTVTPGEAGGIDGRYCPSDGFKMSGFTFHVGTGGQVVFGPSGATAQPGAPESGTVRSEDESEILLQTLMERARAQGIVLRRVRLDVLYSNGEVTAVAMQEGPVRAGGALEDGTLALEDQQRHPSPTYVTVLSDAEHEGDGGEEADHGYGK